MRCVECSNKIPNAVIIDGKRRNLQNRTRCLDCLPFGASIYRKKSLEEERTYNARMSRQWYKRTKEKLGRCPIHVRREAHRSFILSFIGGKCQLCCYSKCNRNLIFHHLYDKQFKLSSREFQSSLKRLLPELRKCAVVCSNCHGEIHGGLIPVKIVKKAHRQFIKAISALSENQTWTEATNASR